MLQVKHGKMFTIRFKSYRIFQYFLVLMVFVSSGVIAGDSPKKCAEFNEYCLNHWDCCSNSCMSYLYRCTRGHNIYPYPFLGVSYKPTVTLDQILSQNFGEPSLQLVSQPQQKPYFASRFGGDIEENNMKESSTEVKFVLENSQETTTFKNEEELTKTPVAFENRLGEESDEKTTKTEVEDITDNKIITTTVGKPSCAEIGEKCYRHDECCSKLCHGYLHQCVT